MPPTIRRGYLPSGAEPVDFALAPKYVRREARDIVPETGYPLVITNPEPCVWHITVTSERVHFVAVYSRAHATKGKRNCFVNATASVDGGPARPVSSLDELGALFCVPESLGTGRTPTPPAHTPLAAPRIAREAYAALQGELPDDAAGHLQIRLGRVGTRWVLALDADRVAWRLIWRIRDGRWVPQLHRTELFIDGVNRAAEIAGDVGKAVALIAPVLRSVPKTVGTPTGPATTPTSVQVRTTKVLRN